jgi:hypothetical protein
MNCLSQPYPFSRVSTDFSPYIADVKAPLSMVAPLGTPTDLLNPMPYQVPFAFFFFCGGPSREENYFATAAHSGLAPAHWSRLFFFFFALAQLAETTMS